MVLLCYLKLGKYFSFLGESAEETLQSSLASHVLRCVLGVAWIWNSELSKSKQVRNNANCRLDGTCRKQRPRSNKLSVEFIKSKLWEMFCFSLKNYQSWGLIERISRQVCLHLILSNTIICRMLLSCFVFGTRRFRWSGFKDAQTLWYSLIFYWLISSQ